MELVDMARPAGRGLAWPWRQTIEDGAQATMPGWCNGAAGMVHLACLGHRLLGEDLLLQAAQGAAWQACGAGGRAGGLCVGLAGRAYARRGFRACAGRTAL